MSLYPHNFGSIRSLSGWNTNSGHVSRVSNEMADAISVIGTASEALALTQVLYKYISGVAEAPKQARDLLGEVVAIGEVLRALRERLSEAHERGDGGFDQTSVLFVHLNGCKGILEKLQKKLAPLASSGKWKVKNLWPAMKWPLEKEDMIQDVEALHRYAQIFHFAVNLDGL